MNDSSKQKRSLGILLVILATAGWGTSGLFISLIAARTEISALALAFWRDFSTFICLLLGVGILKPASLRVKRADLVWLACLGVFSIGTFHVLWNLNVWMNGVAVATVVQETAPAFVAVAAWLFLRESLTKVKVLAVLVTFVGCVLVAGLDVRGVARVTPAGLLAGLGSAIAYGTFSLFGKRVTGNYSPWTVLTYGFGFGTLVLFPLQFLSPGTWPILTPAGGWFIGLILLPTIASFAIYTVGLRFLSASVAAIVATSEVVFASIFAYLFLAERLNWLQWIGAALVVGGVVILYVFRPAGRVRQASREAPSEAT